MKMKEMRKGGLNKESIEELLNRVQDLELNKY